MHSKVAHREYMRKYRSDPERAEKNRQVARNWRAKNRERHRESVRQWQLQNPDRVRRLEPEEAHRRRVRYIFGENYDAWFEQQHGVCAICGLPETARKKYHLALDHDHHTGRARGLLCLRCNVSLSNFERGHLKTRFHRDPRLMVRALEYLG